MSQINTGGPAFPTREKIGEQFDDYTNTYRDVFGDFGGMTLRDYFAAKATDADVAYCMLRVPLVNDEFPDNWRQQARYIHADEMLKAREV